ncbi:MAG: hypothetical protein V7609_1251 [Verrucomicrobiota bacterium]
MRSKTSAGLLMFRKRENRVEVLLVHPGGPFFRKKDDGVWTIPKGEVAEGEDLLERAKIELEEELGVVVAPIGPWIELGWVKQKGGKTVHGWAFEGNLPETFAVASNTFDLEWSPRSGKLQRFPEIDRAEFFSVKKARAKINVAQTAFLDRLVTALDSAKSV